MNILFNAEHAASTMTTYDPLFLAISTIFNAVIGLITEFAAPFKS